MKDRPLPIGEWCDTCSYPSHACVCKQLEADEAAQKKAQRDADIVTLGGLKAYDEFHLNKLVELPCNVAAIKGCREFHCDRSNLMLTGPTGTGKTHMAVGVARQFIRDWRKVIVAKPFDIFQTVREGVTRNVAQERASLRMYIEAPLLVIDDLGVGKDTEFTLGTLYRIIDGRLMAKRHGLIVTTNLSLDQLAERFNDDRVVSRLAGECEVFDLTGCEDWRITNKRSSK